MAGAMSMSSSSRPMSVEEISKKAEDFQFDPAIALKFWLRTADTLYREADIYEQEGNDQQAYLLLFRYAHLVTQHLPTHPQVHDPTTKPGYFAAIKTTNNVVFPQMENVLKPRINARYERWRKGQDQRRETHAAFDDERRTPIDPAASDPAVAGNTTTLAAADNSDLAVKLARSEIRRRETKRRATRSGASEQDEQERRTAGVWDDWEAALSKKGQSNEHSSGKLNGQFIEIPNDDDKMRRNMEASRRQMDGTHNIVPDGARRQRLQKPPPRPSRPLPQTSENSEYHYPKITKPQPVGLDSNTSSRSRSRSRSRTRGPCLPPKPPKERFADSPLYGESQPTYEEPPPRPEKSRPHSHVRTPTPVQVARDYTFKPSAYLENGKPLRTVFLPPTLREKFLEIAAPNTRNNLETCGMLCGTLVSNALFVSQVVIPEQESTSDTCETINESVFFDYCAAEDLMVLGWIHTHPSQTCFMSSRDLHTHCGYQIMMPESIAIVCAPSKTPSWGIFRLTDPPGMKSVLNCRKTGLFHPHEESNIYTDAQRPMGHVFEATGMDFQVVDLRPQ